MTITQLEISTQPAVWRQALGMIDEAPDVLRRPGGNVLVLGCNPDTPRHLTRSIVLT